MTSDLQVIFESLLTDWYRAETALINLNASDDDTFNEQLIELNRQVGTRRDEFDLLVERYRDEYKNTKE